MSQKSNPIDYRLKPVVDRHAVDLHLAALRKRVKLIFRSFMKRMRAAYAFRVKQLNASQALREDTKQHELRMWAYECSDAEEEINIWFNQVTDLLTPTKWMATYRGAFDVRNYDTITNDKIDNCNKGIKLCENEIKRMEERGHKAMRNLAKDKSGFTEREHEIYQTRIHRKNLTALMLELKKNYPYIREKYRARLAKLIFAFIDNERKHGMITRAPRSIFHAPNYTMYDLVKIGIPAADVVGPWWPHTKDIKSPMGFVDFCDKSYGDIADVRYGNYRSPGPHEWLVAAGLDGNDHHLRGSVIDYHHRHKVAPSVEWARRRSNELEGERTQKDMEDQIPKVEEWLEASSYWRRSADYADITIPELPDPTFRVLKPGDGELLCRAAKRDGLCVVDAVTNLVDKAQESSYRGDTDEEEEYTKKLYMLSEHENFVTLIISTDPRRRTVVGLNSKGFCSSEHHCTGIQNKVDLVAWEYFKTPH